MLFNQVWERPSPNSVLCEHTAKVHAILLTRSLNLVSAGPLSDKDTLVWARTYM